MKKKKAFRQYYKNDPRWIAARYDSTCADCGKKVGKGDKILYWPKGKKVYCKDCGEGRYAEFRALADDEDFFFGRSSRKVQLRRLGNVSISQLIEDASANKWKDVYCKTASLHPNNASALVAALKNIVQKKAALLKIDVDDGDHKMLMVHCPLFDKNVHIAEVCYGYRYNPGTGRWEAKDGEYFQCNYNPAMETEGWPATRTVQPPTKTARMVTANGTGLINRPVYSSDKDMIYCSDLCAKHDGAKDYEPLDEDEYEELNWPEEGEGARYGQMCPVCESPYEDAYDRTVEDYRELKKWLKQSSVQSPTKTARMVTANDDDEYEYSLRRQIEDIEQKDFEQSGLAEEDDIALIELPYTVYLIANGAAEGTWQFVDFDNAFEAYKKAKKIVTKKIVKLWGEDEPLEEGDGAYFYDATNGEMIDQYPDNRIGSNLATRKGKNNLPKHADIMDDVRWARPDNTIATRKANADIANEIVERAKRLGLGVKHTNSTFSGNFEGEHRWYFYSLGQPPYNLRSGSVIKGALWRTPYSKYFLPSIRGEREVFEKMLAWLERAEKDPSIIQPQGKVTSAHLTSVAQGEDGNTLPGEEDLSRFDSMSEEELRNSLQMYEDLKKVLQNAPAGENIKLQDAIRIIDYIKQRLDFSGEEITPLDLQDEKSSIEEVEFNGTPSLENVATKEAGLVKEAPAILDRCVKQVMAEGKTKSQAYAICISSLRHKYPEVEEWVHRKKKKVSSMESVMEVPMNELSYKDLQNRLGKLNEMKFVVRSSMNVNNPASLAEGSQLIGKIDKEIDTVKQLISFQTLDFDGAFSKEEAALPAFDMKEIEKMDNAVAEEFKRIASAQKSFDWSTYVEVAPRLLVETNKQLCQFPALMAEAARQEINPKISALSPEERRGIFAEFMTRVEAERRKAVGQLAKGKEACKKTASEQNKNHPYQMFL